MVVVSRYGSAVWACPTGRLAPGGEYHTGVIWVARSAAVLVRQRLPASGAVAAAWRSVPPHNRDLRRSFGVDGQSDRGIIWARSGRTGSSESRMDAPRISAGHQPDIPNVPLSSAVRMISASACRGWRSQRAGASVRRPDRRRGARRSPTGRTARSTRRRPVSPNKGPAAAGSGRSPVIRRSGTADHHPGSFREAHVTVGHAQQHARRPATRPSPPCGPSSARSGAAEASMAVRQQDRPHRPGGPTAPLGPHGRAHERCPRGHQPCGPPTDGHRRPRAPQIGKLAPALRPPRPATASKRTSAPTHSAYHCRRGTCGRLTGPGAVIGRWRSSRRAWPLVGTRARSGSGSEAAHEKRTKICCA